MMFSIGQIFRRPDLDRSTFRRHYETRHTALARQVLPRFSLYIRNHVVADCGGDAPDCISEFGFADDSVPRAIAAILGDERGRVLLEDELRFMDKSRNAPFAVTRRVWMETAPAGAHKGVVALTAEPGAVERVRAVAAEAGFSAATLCASKDGQRAWLLGWSPAPLAPAALRRQLIEARAPVLWCAAVEEARGYPDEAPDEKPGAQVGAAG